MTNEAKTKMQEIADAVKSATVAIVLYHSDIPEKDNRPFTVIGSGFCIHSQGIIVTCKHVLDGFIDPDNRQPHVIFYHPKVPGRSELYFNIVPAIASINNLKLPETEGVFDLAMLKIAPPSEGYKGSYPFLSTADYDDLYEMMNAATCGFPLGSYSSDELKTLTSSFTKSMISSIIPWPGVPQDKLLGFQLDLRVVQGNSGGPVFSLTSGKVFGVLKGGIEWEGIQFLARAEPVYPTLAHGLVENLLQGTPFPTPSEVS